MSQYDNLRFKNVRLEDGKWKGLEYVVDDFDPISFIASPTLFVIKQAWERGLDVEDLADGFGPGNGTMGGDWSGVRDSSEEAINAMLTRALNFLFIS